MPVILSAEQEAELSFPALFFRAYAVPLTRPATLAFSCFFRPIFVRRSRLFVLFPSKLNETDATGLYYFERKVSCMNTYRINVRKWSDTEYIIEASSLEEAKRKAISRNQTEKQESHVKTEAICRNFYPYRTIPG